MAARAMDSRFTMALLLCAAFGLSGCSDEADETTTMPDGTGGGGGTDGTGGSGGTAGTGGTSGTGGTGDFTIEGKVVDVDDTTGLQKVLVWVAGVDSDFTDAEGDFLIEVSRAGRYRVCAVGSIPRRFVSTNCGTEGDVEVSQAGQPALKKLNIQSGYYMELMDESFQAFDFMRAAGAEIKFDLDHLVWNRSGVGQTRTYIVVGINGDAQFAHEIANAGPFDAQTGAGEGTDIDVTLTAAGGTIYARLLALGSAMDAIDEYEAGFDASRETNYVDLGTVTIVAPP